MSTQINLFRMEIPYLHNFLMPTRVSHGLVGHQPCKLPVYEHTSVPVSS